MKQKVTIDSRTHNLRVHMYYVYKSGSTKLNLLQTMTLHERWKVYRGVSTEECDFLYTMKKSKVVQLTTKLEVFLGHNNEEQICDFRVKVTKRFEHSCVVYAGESDNIVAQVNSLTLFPSSISILIFLVEPAYIRFINYFMPSFFLTCLRVS